METISVQLVKKNPLSVPAILAERRGLFKKYGLDMKLDLIEDFVFNGNHPFYEGTSDTMMGDVTFFFYMLERGKKAVITSNLTRTIQLVGRGDLADSLEGLKVGVNRKGLFRLYLENDLKDLLPGAEVVWMNNSYERMAALESGEIDALVAIEPFVTDLVEKGHKVLWHSNESDKNLVMWAFDEEFYKAYPHRVKAFHEALEEAGHLFNDQSKEEKIRMCIEEIGYSEEMARRMCNFEFEPQSVYRLEDFNLCMEWMYREKEISKCYEGEKLIVDPFK